MRKSFVLWSLLALGPAAAVPAPGAAESGVTKMALVTIETTALIGVPPHRLWKALTDAEQAKMWCPYWAGAAETGPLSEVGASIAFRDEYGTEGRSVIVYADKDRQLRVAHVPDDGSYLCQTVFRLAGEGSGTRLTVIEQYSDRMDVPLDRDTAAAARRGLEAYVKALGQAAGGAPGR